MSVFSQYLEKACWQLMLFECLDSKLLERIVIVGENRKDPRKQIVWVSVKRVQYELGLHADSEIIEVVARYAVMKAYVKKADCEDFWNTNYVSLVKLKPLFCHVHSVIYLQKKRMANGNFTHQENLGSFYCLLNLQKCAENTFNCSALNARHLRKERMCKPGEITLIGTKKLAIEWQNNTASFWGWHPRALVESHFLCRTDKLSEKSALRMLFLLHLNKCKDIFLSWQISFSFFMSHCCCLFLFPNWFIFSHLQA